MKYYTNDTKTLEILAWTADGKYFLMIRSYRNHICSTKTHGEQSYSAWWDDFTKQFDTKEHANAYFFKVKQSNPSLTIANAGEREHNLVNKYMHNFRTSTEKKEKWRLIAEEIELQYGEAVRQEEERDRKEREEQENWIEQMHF